MKHDKPGIDLFRVIAALLVIAIHIGPLETINPSADFLLTHVIARIAVPFFFMTSGYFLVSHYHKDESKLLRFIKKTAWLYMIAIIIYIPAMIYSHGFTAIDSLPVFLRIILFDGPFYHLWYLPAALTGAIIATLLVHHLNYRKALIITFILYCIGLGGDSYYGLISQLPALKWFYSQLFLIFSYTRNGLFMAPIFFVMGGYLHDETHDGHLPLLLSSLILMIVEAGLLAHIHAPRHDSMYLCLLPFMYQLFIYLLSLKTRSHQQWRTVSMVMYIIHPLVLIAVRLVAKVTRATVIVNQQLILYLLVAVLSYLCGCLVLFFTKKYGKKPLDHATDRSYIELNIDHLKHNVDTIKNSIDDDSEMIAVIKTNAYGHGVYEIAIALDQMGVRHYAVATIDEAIALRQYGIQGEILILGYTPVERACDLHRYHLTQTLIDASYAQALNEQKIAIKAHIKIDTGMHRLGYDSRCLDQIIDAFHYKYIQITGIMSHLCCADSLQDDDIAFTREQIAQFNQVIDGLKQHIGDIPPCHIQSSYGFLNYPDLHYDYVRAGIMLYGLLSSPEDQTVRQLDLKPVLSLKSRIVLIRDVAEGETIGYGRTYQTTRPSKIGIVPIGYGDGLPRILSNKGYVMINHQKAPIVGRICMDQLAIDVTDIKADLYDDVILIDDQMTADLIADDAQSISNELLSRLSTRLSVIAK